MHAIRARIQNGRIEPDAPLDLPEGTEVLILPQDTEATSGLDGNGDEDGFWDDSPEGVEAWLKELASLQPLIFTPEERAALDKDRAERKVWELAHFEERAEKLRKLWE